MQVHETPSSRSHRLAAWAVAALGFALPLSTAADSFVLTLVLIAWLLGGEWSSKWQRLRHHRPTLAVAIFLSLAGLGVFWGMGTVAEGLQHLRKYLDLLLVAILASLQLTPAEQQRALNGFAVAMAVTLIMSYSIALGLAPVDMVQADSTAAILIVFKKHITHGFFMAMASLLYAVRALETRDLRWRVFFGVAALLAAANVLMLDGRTGHLALFAMAVYFIAHRLHWRGQVITLVASALLVTLAYQLPHFPSPKRLALGLHQIEQWESGQGDPEASMGKRMDYWSTSLKIIATHPLLGVGTGGFESAYRQAAAAGIPASNNPHNQYLLTQSQLGIPGLLALLALFAVAWREARFIDTNMRLLVRGFLLAYVLANVFNSFLYDHAERLFFAWMLGVFFSNLPPRWQRLRPGKSPA